MILADLEAAREGIARHCGRLPSVNATALQIIASIFPYQHAIPTNYFSLSDAEAERVGAEAERHAKARELKIKAFHDFVYGIDTNALRIPRPDAGRYTRPAQAGLIWAAILGADSVFRRAATYSLIANMRLENGGFFAQGQGRPQ